jgi:hypothetical protein
MDFSLMQLSELDVCWCLRLYNATRYSRIYGQFRRALKTVLFWYRSQRIVTLISTMAKIWHFIHSHKYCLYTCQHSLLSLKAALFSPNWQILPFRPKYFRHHAMLIHAVKRFDSQYLFTNCDESQDGGTVAVKLLEKNTTAAKDEEIIYQLKSCIIKFNLWTFWTALPCMKAQQSRVFFESYFKHVNLHILHSE